MKVMTTQPTESLTTTLNSGVTERTGPYSRLRAGIQKLRQLFGIHRVFIPTVDLFLPQIIIPRDRSSRGLAREFSGGGHGTNAQGGNMGRSRSPPKHHGRRSFAPQTTRDRDTGLDQRNTAQHLPATSSDGGRHRHPIPDQRVSRRGTQAIGNTQIQPGRMRRP